MSLRTILLTVSDIVVPLRVIETPVRFAENRSFDVLPLGKRDSVKPTKRALILGAWIGRSRSGDHGVIPYRIRRTGYLLGVAAE